MNIAVYNYLQTKDQLINVESNINYFKIMGISPIETVFYLAGSVNIDDRDLSWSDAIQIIKLAHKKNSEILL